ncbi:MAG: hypothetical protein PHH09_13800 [Methanoregulaceae archaeon]|nr:hypothetical protein [Methanoregulaceae archaeon]
MARRREDNPMNLIIAIAIGILTLIAVFSVIPVVGGSIDNAMPALEEGSEWNTTTNTDLPSGASMWTQLGPLLVLAVLALVIGLVIMYFRNAAG